MEEIRESLLNIDQNLKKMAYVLDRQLEFVAENANEIKADLLNKYLESKQELEEEVSQVKEKFDSSKKTMDDFINSYTPENVESDLNELKQKINKEVDNFEQTLDKEINKAESALKLQSAKAKADFKVFEAKIKLKTAMNNLKNSLRASEEAFEYKMQELYGEDE